MDPEQRAIAVKARMNELKALHLPLARPCADCRFGPINGTGLGICEHYANWEISADPVTGKRRGRVAVSTSEARSADGLCGPEGLLFDGYRGWRRTLRWLHLRGEAGVAMLLFGTFLAAFFVFIVFCVVARYYGLF